jgi:plasmid stabilization system protein ParE
MDSAVVYSEPALGDLREITAYIARDNVEAAKQFANRLVDLAESLRRIAAQRATGKGLDRCSCDRAFALSDFLPL